MKIIGTLALCLLALGCQSKERRMACNDNYGFKKNPHKYPYHSCEKNSDGSFKTLKDRAIFHHRQNTDNRTGRRTHKDQRIY